jgi:hypothetical protein
MSDMAEDRVYEEDAGAREVFVAAGIGVVAVSVSADRIGRFGVARRCSPRDVAAGDGLVAVATGEDVLVRQVESEAGDGDETFSRTGFGPAEAVGIRDGSILAAGNGGEIAVASEGAWTTIGRVGGNVAAIDGSLIATDAGLYRIEADGSAERVRVGGFEVVNDVAAAGPFVATDAGLYALREEWQWELEGPCRAVSAASPDRAHAAGRGLYTCRDGDWTAVRTGGSEEVVDVATGERGYAVTEEGTLLVGPEWRSRALGLSDVVGIAVA